MSNHKPRTAFPPACRGFPTGVVGSRRTAENVKINQRTRSPFSPLPPDMAAPPLRRQPSLSMTSEDKQLLQRYKTYAERIVSNDDTGRTSRADSKTLAPHTLLMAIRLVLELDGSKFGAVALDGSIGVVFFDLIHCLHAIHNRYYIIHITYHQDI